MMVSEEQLVSELWARDVRFLMGHQLSTSPLLDSIDFIVLLAQSENARVRYSLIPLFLRHPKLAAEVEMADERLANQSSQMVLQFYYTAAVFLQKKYQGRITNILGTYPALPDLFSNKLGIQTGEKPEQALSQLAKKHQILSGQSVNWLGTYEHAAEVWLKQMELQRA